MITKIPFGRTGHLSSRILFGAAAMVRSDDKQAGQILDMLLKYGVNHIDTAASYGDSELWVGKWMPQYRSEFFLASKTGERTYEAAYAEIQKSLERLQTDQIDLIQLHNLVDPEAWETALGPDGALKAALEAKEKGYVRFIGVTGHGLSVAARHLMSLKRFSFDSVLLPYNYEFMHKKEQYPADFDALYRYCQDNEVATQTIKSVASGRWGDEERHRTTWYKPLEHQHEIDAAVAFVLNRPGIFLNSASDPVLLERTLDAASRWSAGDAFGDFVGILAGMELNPLFVDSDAI